MPGPFREALPGSTFSSQKGFLSQVGQIGSGPLEIARMESLSREPVSALAPPSEVPGMLPPGPLFGGLALQEWWLFLQFSEMHVYLENAAKGSRELECLGC